MSKRKGKKYESPKVQYVGEYLSRNSNIEAWLKGWSSSKFFKWEIKGRPRVAKK